MSTLIKSLAFFTSFFPLSLYAGAVLNTSYFDRLFDSITGVLGIIPAILVGIAVLIFFFGLARYLFLLGNGGDEELANAKRLMIWGIIGVTVMVTIYGLIIFLQLAFGITNNNAPDTPKIPTGTRPFTDCFLGIGCE